MFYLKNKKCQNTELLISQKCRQKVFSPENLKDKKPHSFELRVVEFAIWFY